MTREFIRYIEENNIEQLKLELGKLDKLVFGSYHIGPIGARIIFNSALKDDPNTSKDIISIEHLNLDDYKLDIEEKIVLANNFKNIDDVKFFNIDLRYLRPEEVIILAEALKDNRSIQNIDLDCQKIKNYGAIVLADALKDNKFIRELNLANNEIKGEGVKAIVESLMANNSIRILNLYNNKIEDEGAEAIIKFIKYNRSIEELNLSTTYISRKVRIDIIEGLKDNKSIQVLNLSYNELEFKGAEALANLFVNNDSIRILNLAHTDINNLTPSDFREMRKAGISIEKINDMEIWEGTKVIADALKHNRSIQALNLADNKIEDAGATFLADTIMNNDSIRILNLAYNDIGNAGAEAIRDALKDNKSIVHLDLSNNPIDQNIKEEIDKIVLRNKKNLDQLRKNIVEAAKEGKDLSDKDYRLISQINKNTLKQYLDDYCIYDGLSDREVKLIDNFISKNRSFSDLLKESSIVKNLNSDSTLSVLDDDSKNKIASYVRFIDVKQEKHSETPDKPNNIVR